MIPCNGNYNPANVDWLICRIKEALKEWDVTQHEWEETKEYLKNFFTNLDLQEEVNNWLDNALENDELSNIFYYDYIYITNKNFYEEMVAPDNIEYKNFLIQEMIEITNDIQISNMKYCNIKGKGFLKSGFKVTPTNGGLKFLNCDSVNFEDVCFLGNSTGDDPKTMTRGNGDYSICVEDSPRFTFTRCTFRYNSYDGAIISHSWMTLFNYCYFLNSYNRCVYIKFKDTVAPMTIFNSCFFNNNGNIGVETEVGQVFFNNCTFQNSGNNHIKINSDFTYIYNINVSNGDMEISGKEDFAFTGINNIDNVTIYGLTLANSSEETSTEILSFENFSGELNSLIYKQNNTYRKKKLLKDDFVNILNTTCDIDFTAEFPAYNQILNSRGKSVSNRIPIPIKIPNYGNGYYVNIGNATGKLTIVMNKNINNVYFYNTFTSVSLESDDNITWSGDINGYGILYIEKTANPDAVITEAYIDGYIYK